VAKLDIVFGKKSNPYAIDVLVKDLGDQEWEGTLYVGYPVLGGEDNLSVTDALLTCTEHGLVIFDLNSEEFMQLSAGEINGAILYRQKELRRKLNSRLVAYENLVKEDGITLAFPINVFSFFPQEISGVELKNVVTPQNLLKTLMELPPLEERFVKPLNAAIQKTAALKPKKRRLNVKNADSMGSAIKYLEAQIANLDRWQKNAAIESPDGPQRIRGLAGSGKTIILAMKAAYLHANDPEAKLVVTFNTRSLYQQFRTLIRRFYFDQVFDEPNWDKLQILHAWGSNNNPGVYSTIAKHAGVISIPFGSARYKFGYSDAFKGTCDELIEVLKKSELRPIFDYVLIDEAQDFPASFFQLAYLATKGNKKIVWAYDELQNLSDSSMPSLDKLFGLDSEGKAKIDITNIDGQPQKDILLPICYRNPQWLLSFALGLGLGIKLGDGSFAQMFLNTDFWHEIGYQDINDNLGFGNHVRLRRNPDRSATFFEDRLTSDESISWHHFLDLTSQADWIAHDIERVRKTQELDLNDILIVIPDSINSATIGQIIADSLLKKNIDSHLIGVTGSQDIVFVDDSVAICSIYRAKGNEAPLVYVTNADYCNAGFDLAKKRNILFTALTRAKAWVRICGIGVAMLNLMQEMEAIKADSFELDFVYPTESQIAKMRSAYKERTSSEKRKVKTEIKSTQKLLQRLTDGDLDINELPPELLTSLRKLLK